MVVVVDPRGHDEKSRVSGLAVPCERVSSSGNSQVLQAGVSRMGLPFVEMGLPLRAQLWFGSWGAPVRMNSCSSDGHVCDDF